MSRERYQEKRITRRECVRWLAEAGAVGYLSYLTNKTLLNFAEAVEARFNPETPTPTPTNTPQPTPETKVLPTPAPESEPRYHVVQPGENLFRIGLKYGLTVSEMAVTNNISSPFIIHSGQKLLIPEGGIIPMQEFSSLRVIVGEPENYQLTYKDKRFLSWFNEKSRFWTDWNGKEHQYFVPEDVCRDAKTAERESGLPWYVLVAVGFTETGYYDGANWNPGVTSNSGARGRYQIMPFNWVFQPYEGSLYDPKLNALTATNYILYLGLGDIDKETWTWNFTGGNYSRPCWNLHLGQAKVTWEIIQYLKKDYLYAQEHVK